MDPSTKTPTIADLGSHINFKLIELVRHHQILYATTSRYGGPMPHPHRRNRTTTNLIWKSISNEVGIPAENCKRRWKCLKDVFAKIRKRRLQEQVMGRIGVFKKWIYEDAMKFIKFRFEDTFQSGIGSTEEMGWDEVTNEDIDGNDTMEDVGNDYRRELESMVSTDEKSQSQFEDLKEEEIIEYLDLEPQPDSLLDLERSSSIGDSVENESLVTSTNNKSCRETAISKSDQPRNFGIIRQLQLRTRPKAYHPYLLARINKLSNKSKLLENEANYHTIVVSDPSSWSRSDLSLYANDDRRTMSERMLKIKDESLITERSSNANDLIGTRVFFQSMARTVSKLPLRGQAEVKMAICKIVTNAEIEQLHSAVDPESPTRRCKNKNG